MLRTHIVKPMARVASFSIACVLLLAATVQAAELFTPVLTGRPIEDDDYRCFVLNAGKKAIEVDLAIYDDEGAELASKTARIPPGETESVIDSDTDEAQAYCKVTGRFSKTKVQVTFCVRIESDDRCQMTAFAP